MPVDDDREKLAPMAQDRANDLHLRVTTAHLQDRFNAVAWSPDGACIATGSSDRTVRIWNAASGKLLRTLQGHSQAVRSVSWSADSKSLASGADDDVVRIWDAGSGEQLRALEGYYNFVNFVSWSADGRSLACGSENTLRIWDAASGKRICTLKGHLDFVTSVSWSTDGLPLSANVSETALSSKFSEQGERGIGIDDGSRDKVSDTGDRSDREGEKTNVPPRVQAANRERSRRVQVARGCRRAAAA